MGKLDRKRKIVLITIGLAFIFFGFMGRPQSMQTATTQTPQEVVVGQPIAVPEATQAVEVQPTPTVESPVPVVPAPKDVEPVAQPLSEAKIFEKFFIYQDNPNKNHYVLSGLMPQGKCINVNSSWNENCQEGQQCLQITYDVECSKEDEGWAGAYWLEPANNWGEQKGGHNLTGAHRLVFWARGEKGGEIIDMFKVGGILGDHKYPDSDTAVLGPVKLTQDWKQYTIDLSGMDLSYIVGGFSWSADVRMNPETITFYLDNIYFE